MDKVLEQLNFYDIFGYLMPGAIVVAAALLLADAVWSDVNVDPGEASPFELAGLPILAYLIGHIVQWPAVGLQSLGHRLFFGGPPSSVFMTAASHRFNAKFRSNLRRILEERYGIGADASDRDRFYTCYSYVIQMGLRRRVEAFLGLAALCRGLVVACLIASFLLAGATAAHVQREGWEAVSYIHGSGAVAAALAIAPFAFRWRRFTGSFAESVYRDFYIAHQPALVSEKEPVHAA